MNIADMHTWFRQYAQQMGMQNVRAILPEQIDLVINTSISDTINQLIRENIGVTNDRIITDNSKIGQINALRSLYKVKTLNIGETQQVYPIAEGSDIGLYRCNYFTEDSVQKVTINTYVTIKRDGSSNTYIKTIEIETIYPDNTKSTTTYTEKVTSETDITQEKALEDTDTDSAVKESQVNLLFLVDLAINYTKGNNKTTNYFPVRLIDDAYLADTLNDFVLKPRVRTPIAVLYNNQLDIYFGDEFKKGNGILSTESLTPKELRVSYISKPAKVSYKSDIGGEDISCDLPESMHVDILKHAVDLYNVSINGNLFAAQQQQRRNNQELQRNEARPVNEDYQQ